MEVVELKFDSQHPIKKNPYSLLLEPRFRCCLEGNDPDEIEFAEVIAIGIENDRIPLGICVASYYPPLQYATIHQLGFSQNPPHTAVIHRLLKALEQELVKRNSILMKLSFKHHDAAPLELISYLQQQGWAAPELILVRYFFDAQTFQPDWYERPPPLPKNVVEFPWERLTEQEKLQVTKDFTQGRFTTHVNPFQGSEKFERINSIGIKHKGRVIGWMICHRVSHDTIRYTSLYINPEYAFHGWPLRLLVDSIHLHQKSNVKWALFELNLSEAPRSWVNFVQKRLAPFAYQKIEIMQTWKKIPSQ